MNGLFDDLIKPAPGTAQPKSASGLFDDMIKPTAQAPSTENGTVLSAIDEGGRKLYALAKNAVSSGPSTLTQDFADAEKVGAKPHATLAEAGKSILHGVQSIGSNLKQEFSGTDTAAKDRSTDDRSYAGKPIAFGVTTDDPDSLGFSLAGMANSLAGRTAGAMAGGAAGGARGAAIGQEAGALTAGGVGTYNMSAYQFAKQFADKADNEAMSTLGRHLTDEERIKVVNDNIGHIRNAAMWEAGPEALGNMLEIPMLGKIAGNAAKIGSKEAAHAALSGGLKATIKRMSESTAGELAKSIGTELTTEAATQIGQSDTNHLLDPSQQQLSFAKPDDWAEAFKEVAPATLFTMGLMGGGAHLGGKLYNRVAGNNQSTVEQGQEATGVTPDIPASIPPAPGVDQTNPRDTFNREDANQQWGEPIRSVSGDVLPPEQPKGPLARAALAAPGVNFQPPEQGVLPRQAIGGMADSAQEIQPVLPRQMVEDKTRTGEVLPPDATLPQPVAGSIDLAPIEGSATRIDDAAHTAATSLFNNAPELSKAQQDAPSIQVRPGAEVGSVAHETAASIPPVSAIPSDPSLVATNATPATSQQSTLPARKSPPFKTAAAAETAATRLSAKYGEHYVVAPHPQIQGRFAALPSREIGSQVSDAGLAHLQNVDATSQVQPEATQVHQDDASPQVDHSAVWNSANPKERADIAAKAGLVSQSGGPSMRAKMAAMRTWEALPVDLREKLSPVVPAANKTKAAEQLHAVGLQLPEPPPQSNTHQVNDKPQPRAGVSVSGELSQKSEAVPDRPGLARMQEAKQQRSAVKPSVTTKNVRKENFGKAAELLMKYTDGNGSPDALSGNEHKEKRAEIVSLLTGKPAKDLRFSESSVGNMEKLIHAAAGVSGDTVSERRASFADALDAHDQGEGRLYSQKKQTAIQQDRNDGLVTLAVRGRRPPRPDNQRVSLPEPLAGNRSNTAPNPVLEPLADQSNRMSVNQKEENLKPADQGDNKGVKPLHSRSNKPFRASEMRDSNGRLLAPNGNPSSLNEYQWHQVRSPEFKAWFGDWEALAAQKRLDEMQPVRVRIPDAWRGVSKPELRNLVEQSLIELMNTGDPLHHPQIGDVGITKNSGVKKTISTSADPAKLYVAGDLRNVFERSVFAASSAPYKNMPNVIAYEKLLAKVEVDGHSLIAAFAVQKNTDGRQYYNTVTLEEETPAVSPRDTLSQEGEERATSAYTGVDSFSRQTLQKVNPSSVSKVVDGNGEPLVVYHGTDRDIDRFEHSAEKRTNKYGGGFYFTNSSEFASMYAEQRGYQKDGAPGANVIPCFLVINKPVPYKIHPVFSQITNNQIQEYEKKKYDGIIHQAGNSSEYVAFDSSQIKSAISNDGGFDGENPNILKSQGQVERQSTIPEIRNALQDAFGKRADRLLNSGNVTIVQSEHDVPGSADHVQSEDGESAPQAFFDPKANKIYLVADGLNPADVPGVMKHEALHKFEHDNPGVFDPAMQQLLAMMRTSLFNGSGAVPAWFNQAWRSVPSDTAPKHVPSEIAAYAVANREGLPSSIKKWAEDFMATIRAALIRMGFAPKQITDADLAALARYQIRRMSNSESFADKAADLVGRIREKRGDHGGDAAGQMASRLKSAMGKPGYTSAIMKMLARVEGNDGLFRYPKAPESMKSLEDVTNAVSEGMASAHETEMDGGNVDKTWVITMPKGDPVFVMEKGDSVWINASALESGEGMGSLAYSIVGNYAHNAGKVFIGDPDGLSVKALFRRTEHMANLALKFGTTKFLMPHDAQVDPKSYYGNRASVSRGDDKAAALATPIKWGSDDRANLEQLLSSAYNNTVALAPEIENVRYDFDHQRFVGRDGKVFGKQQFDEYAKEVSRSLHNRGLDAITSYREEGKAGTVARSIIGSSTLQRSALFNSILRASSDPLSWRSVLDSASRQLSGNQLDEPLQRRFYSKAKAPNDGGFSLGDRLSHGEISQVVEELTGKFAHEIPVSIVDSITDVLPSASANDGNASGVVLNGRIHLIRSGLTDQASVARTLFHEMLHYGLRRFMGKDEYVSTMHELYDSDAYIRNKANQWMQSEEGRAIKGSEDYIKARAADEALASFSEILQGQADSRRNNSLQARVIRTVSRWIANTAKAMGFHDAAAQWEGINNDKARALIGDVFGKLRTGAEKTDGGWHYSDPAWRAIPAAEKVKEAIGKINQTDSTEVRGDHFTLPPVTKAENAQANLQDKFNRWKLVQDAIAKQGGKLLDKINVYLAEERYHKILASKLHDFREKTMVPMAHGWSRDGINVDQMASLLYAQHAPERNKAMQAINPNVKTGSGMSDSDAAAVIAHVKSLPNADAYFKAADRLRAISNRSLDIAVEKGVIPQDMADAFREKYKYYVPLKGWESVDETGANSMGNGTGRGLSVSRGLIQAVGRDSKAGMIIENILHDHEAAIARGEKNEVGRVMLDFLRANPDQALWRIENVAQKPAVGTKDGEPMVVLRNSMSLDDNQVRVFENGEQRVITFADNVLGEQYNDLGTERLPTILRTTTAYNRLLSAVYTAKNPVFIVTNLMRDMQSGMINLAGEVGLSEARKTLRYYGGAMKAMVQYASGKEVTGDWGDWVKRYLDAGGQTGMGWVQGLEDISKKLSMEYDKETGAKNLLKEGRKLRAAQVAGSKAFHAVTDAIEHANIGIENALRLAAFRQAIESGATQERATSLAANLTVNFDRKGKWTPMLGGLWLFFNPRVQGFARVLQTMTKGIHRKQALALMGSMALASLLLTELARGFGDDDDEEKYLNIPEGERSRNWIFMIGDRRIKLPIPPDYLPFATLGKLISDVSHGKQLTKAGEQMMLALVDAAIPLTITGQDGMTTGSVAQGLIPTAFQMPVRIGMNKNGMGGDMMPGTDFTPDNQRMWNATRGTSYDKAAQALAAVGFEVSPESMKEIVRTTTGGLGTFLQQTGDGTVNLATGKDTKSENVPMLSAFTKTESIKDLRSAFYSASNEAREELGRFESGVKHGGDTSGQRMELVALGRQAEKLNVVLGKQNRAMAAVRSNETMSGDQKDRMILQMEAAQGRMYESYLRAYRARVGLV